METEGRFPYYFILLRRIEGECGRQQASVSAHGVQLHLGSASVLRLPGAQRGRVVIGREGSFKEPGHIIIKNKYSNPLIVSVRLHELVLSK